VGALVIPADAPPESLKFLVPCPQCGFGHRGHGALGHAHEGWPDVYGPLVITGPDDRVVVHPTARIDSFVKIEGGQGVTIGRRVHVASFAHLNIGGGVLLLGEGSAVASGAKLVSGSNQPEGRSMSAAAPPGDQVVRRGFVVIEANAFIGTNAVVLPDVTIGKGAVVGAGAVVTGQVAPWTIVAGVPARVIGTRPRT
jgi:galactoside O-acetyltransferase